MPTYLDRYETVRLLGQGIMGMVYLAWQKDLGREVVLKVMHDSVAADPKFRERFEREMQVMAKFQHPYAVTLHDASVQDPKGPFIVMEYVEGVTLEAVLKTNAPMHPARVGRMLYQILEVLHAAHGKGIIHRDLKPANIMVVEPDTPFEKIKVLDFGLAKMVGPAGWTPASVADLNLPGRMVHYLCPEMARGQGMDHRGDLYSVGVILFEMLTGKPPFAGESGAKVLMDHATKAAPSFAEVKAPDWTSSAIESVVRACLAKNPKNRPAGARDLAIMYRKALEQNKGVPEPPLEDSVPPRTTPELPPQPESPTLTPPSLRIEPVLEPPPVAASLSVDKVEKKLQPIQNKESPPPLSATKPVISSDSPAPVSRRPPTLEEIVIDENALVYHIETCLALAAAELKVRSFVQNSGGKVAELVSGMVRGYLRGQIEEGQGSKGSWSWLSRGRTKTDVLVEIFFYLQDCDYQPNKQKITVIMRSKEPQHNGARRQPEPHSPLPNDAKWKAHCTKIYSDLRGYLMA